MDPSAYYAALHSAHCAGVLIGHLAQEEELEFSVTLDNKPYRILALSYKSKLEFMEAFVQVCAWLYYAILSTQYQLLGGNCSSEYWLY